MADERDARGGSNHGLRRGTNVEKGQHGGNGCLLLDGADRSQRRRAHLRNGIPRQRAHLGQRLGRAERAELLESRGAHGGIRVLQQLPQLGREVRRLGELPHQGESVEDGPRVAAQRRAQRAQRRLVEAGELHAGEIEVPPFQRLDEAADILAAGAHQQPDPERDEQQYGGGQRAAASARVLVEQQDRAGAGHRAGLEDAIDERFRTPADVRLHRHVQELHRGVVDGVAEDGIRALREGADEESGSGERGGSAGAEREPERQGQERGEDPVPLEHAPGHPDLHRERHAAADAIEAAEVPGEVVLVQHCRSGKLELEVDDGHRRGADCSDQCDDRQVPLREEGKAGAGEHSCLPHRAGTKRQRGGRGQPRARLGQNRAENELRHHQEQQVLRPEDLRVSSDEKSEDHVRKRPAAADEPEEPLRLASMENVVGQRPELDHHQRPHCLDEDVEAGVDPDGVGDGQHRPESRAQRRASQRAQGVEQAAAHAVGDPRVQPGDEHDGDRAPDVHPGETAGGAIREVEGVADRAADHHGADRVRRIQRHQRDATLLPRADAQAGFERAFDPACHLLSRVHAARRSAPGTDAAGCLRFSHPWSERQNTPPSAA